MRDAIMTWLVGALVVLCAGCEESTCRVGCLEDEDDCIDEAERYMTIATCDSSSAGYNECVEQLCDVVYAQCSARCGELGEEQPALSNNF